MEENQEVKISITEISPSQLTDSPSKKEPSRLDDDYDPFVKWAYCPICDYKAKKEAYLKRHIRKHTGDKPYKCDICDFKTSIISNLKRHIRVHTGDKPFKCDMCAYKTMCSSNLKKHFNTHTGYKPYSCHLCGYRTDRTKAMRRHKLTHSGENCGERKEESYKEDDNEEDYIDPEVDKGESLVIVGL